MTNEDFELMNNWSDEKAAIVKEHDVVEALMEFIKFDADLDDLAKMYSYCVSDKPIRVLSETSLSDAFEKGERI